MPVACVRTIFLLLALAATCGCAALSGSAPESLSSSSTSETTEQADNPVDYSPVDEALGIETLPADGATIIEREVEVQTAISVCMREHGFVYDVPPPSEELLMFVATTEISDEEFARTRGFGISTFVDDLLDDREEPAVDPNMARLDRMSPDEIRAYMQALEGEAFDAVTESDGCLHRAHADVYGPMSHQEVTLESDVQAALDDLYQAIEADPRIIAATDSWAQCMANAGYKFATPDAIYEHLVTLIHPLESVVLAGTSDPTWPGLTLEQRQELAEIQSYELALAAVEWECSTLLVPTYTSVRIEYERHFVSEYDEAFTTARSQAAQ